MIHYTCDRCHCAIDPLRAIRYIVQLEVHCVCETPAEDDESIDHLSLINEVLEAELDPDSRDEARVDASGLTKGAAVEVDPLDELSVGVELDSSSKQFDLCPECYRHYRRNPLARDRSLSLQFSNN